MSAPAVSKERLQPWSFLNLVKKGKYRAAAIAITDFCSNRLISPDYFSEFLTLLISKTVHDEAFCLWEGIEEVLVRKRLYNLRDVAIATLAPYWLNDAFWRQRLCYRLPILMQDGTGLSFYPQNPEPWLLISPDESYAWYFKRKGEKVVIAVADENGRILRAVTVTSKTILYGFGSLSGLTLHATLKENVVYDASMIPLKTKVVACA